MFSQVSPRLAVSLGSHSNADISKLQSLEIYTPEAVLFMRQYVC